MNNIEIKFANTHNLKNISLDIPRNKLVVITGPSGSGKSSLAFDTIFQEGQRRYLESLTASGAPFAQQLPPVNVESIKGLSPTLSLDQKSTITNRRSTVGTITEIYDFLRILFSKCGIAHSPDSGLPIIARSSVEIVEEIIAIADKKKCLIYYPAIKQQKGAHLDVISKAESLGYHHFRINGELYTIEDKIKLDRHAFNDIDVIVDRLVIDKTKEKFERIKTSVNAALQYGNGNVGIILPDTKNDFIYSSTYYCPVAQKSYPSPHPVMFSYNSPKGQCKYCLGIGSIEKIDADKIFEVLTLSVFEQPNLSTYFEQDNLLKSKLEQWFKKNNLEIDTPISKISKTHLSSILNGASQNSKIGFLGIIPYLDHLIKDRDFESMGVFDLFLSAHSCPACDGKRLLPYPLSFKYLNRNIDYFVKMDIEHLYEFFNKNAFQHTQGILHQVESKLIQEIKSRLSFLLNVGLNYLTLNRTANSLSGGELQRIRLASQLGSQLSGVVYILDEPSIGLHQRDNLKLINTLKQLRDNNNSVLVVEHDEETIRHADHVIDIGPGAGEHGGFVLFNDVSKKIEKSNSSTGDFLSGREKIEVPKLRRSAKEFFKISNCKSNNLKNVTCSIPLGVFSAITGVSGSGKSTLIHQEVASSIKDFLKGKTSTRINLKKGILDDINVIDQKPIGRSPKSIPLSYCGIYDHIRQIFSNTMNAKLYGLSQSHFSFNVKAGRCPECEGSGSLKFEMTFLIESYIPCPKCNGKRFLDQVLDVKYKGLNIDDVLNLTVEHAMEFFANHRKIFHTLKTMNDIGLGYLRLGQSATSLSGGEAQRIKLSRSLSKMKQGHVFYVLDEPTTGLHFKDIKMLLKAINSLVEKGNTVVVIEHNLDLIKCADYIIDLGVDGGNKGGEIIATGTPEEIIKSKISLTAIYLKDVLK